MENRKDLNKLLSEIGDKQKTVQSEQIKTLDRIDEKSEAFTAKAREIIEHQQSTISYLYDRLVDANETALELQKEKNKLVTLVNKLTSEVSDETLDKVLLELNDGIDIYDEYIDYLNSEPFNFDEEKLHEQEMHLI